MAWWRCAARMDQQKKPQQTQANQCCRTACWAHKHRHTTNEMQTGTSVAAAAPHLEALVQQRRGLLLAHVGPVLLPHQRPRQVVAKPCGRWVRLQAAASAAGRRVESSWGRAPECFTPPGAPPPPPRRAQRSPAQSPQPVQPRRSLTGGQVHVGVVGANHAHGAQEGLALVHAAHHDGVPQRVKPAQCGSGRRGFATRAKSSCNLAAAMCCSTAGQTWVRGQRSSGRRGARLHHHTCQKQLQLQANPRHVPPASQPAPRSKGAGGAA